MNIKVVLRRSFSSFSTCKEAEMEAAARRGVEAVGLEFLRGKRLKMVVERRFLSFAPKPALSVELWFFHLFSTIPRPFQNISNKNLGNALFKMYAIENSSYSVKEWHCSF